MIRNFERCDGKSGWIHHQKVVKRVKPMPKRTFAGEFPIWYGRKYIWHPLILGAAFSDQALSVPCCPSLQDASSFGGTISDSGKI